ncbi:hypothetical protein PORCRE_1569 [Porphyromonas crevioricanis JCM 15906]|uniref:Uncharacterized protein n=1 Tax=Porphyromonas crevioricanis JCM 15906 TaxID=1305617 RepID=T1DSU0_9PORP|nr:hypothetical protein PORCRE_1569 [Porphyromonas crevioricanis JCM 15906]GAD07991.1 hypothetical protein PORCAN_1621 [Porphyromonas crevioricanis JCM 13913]
MANFLGLVLDLPDFDQGNLIAVAVILLKIFSQNSIPLSFFRQPLKFYSMTSIRN